MPTPQDIASVIDHTVLKPEAGWDDVQRVIDEAVAHGFASVCVNGAYVAHVAEALRDSPIKTCGVVGFPLGAGSAVSVCTEAVQVVMEGADEIDFVAPLPAVLAEDVAQVEQLFHVLVESVRETRPNVVIKVILETAVLMKDAESDVAERRIASACRIAKAAGLNFVKTSTGFHPAGGATIEAVRLLAKHADGMGVKASGGIRTWDDAVAMTEAGATRLGCSAGVAIVSGAS